MFFFSWLMFTHIISDNEHIMSIGCQFCERYLRSDDCSRYNVLSCLVTPL
jgi:hypothetical protein